MTVDEAGSSSEWSREQDKAFENALATYPEDSSDRWEKIAADVSGKTLEEIKEHYELLEDDVNRIESGCVPLPPYNSSESSADHAGDEGTGKKGSSHYNSDSNHGSKNSRSDQERRKGIAWTEDEHREAAITFGNLKKDVWEKRINIEFKCYCFRWISDVNFCIHAKNGVCLDAKSCVVKISSLLELHVTLYLGVFEVLGDWRSISRNFVVTRTPTQVASHAQKYFIRLNSMNKDRRRSSIHDITSVGNGDISAPQGPITGHSNGAAAGGSSGKSTKQPPQHPAAPPGVGMYGTPTIGQPIGGPLVSAVGTPVNLPASAHMAYGVRAPVLGAVVPSAPMNMGHVTYPMPHTSAHR